MAAFDFAKVKDPTFFKENVLNAHASFRTYASREEYRTGSSSLALKLDGIWKFAYAKNYTSAIPGFEKTDYDCSGWDDIHVPAHIQMEGYDIPQYSNIQYPWDGREEVQPGEIPQRFNPVASYVKYFELPESMQGKPVHIEFEGVESGMALWLNGSYVGYTEDSFSAHAFDLTPYLQPGVNKLAVQVFKWTSSSWCEDQDFFRFSGIFRSVWLYAIPTVHLEDISVKTLFAGDDFTHSTLEVALQVEGKGAARLTLRRSELEVFSEKIALKGGSALFSHAVENPYLWSAEDPALYELEIELLDDAGHLVEVTGQKVGFRKFELKNNRMLLNGKRIVFKGANRHEFSSITGRAVGVHTHEELLRDIITMKQNNINAIRTSHYQNQDALYDLCDEYGLYLIAENNLESHGTWDIHQAGIRGIEGVLPNDKPEWKAVLFDRMNSTYQRDKNHPAVLIWSLGNESFGGETLLQMAEMVRRFDDTRLVHYEGVVNDPRFLETTDIESHMYSTVKDIKEYLAQGDKRPYIECEYSHAMGNSNGALHKYTELADQKDCGYQGGFIWDYIDQSIWKKDRYGKWFQAYGGDFGDRPCDWEFSCDGIVFADRTPKPQAQAVKALYAPVTLTPSAQGIRLGILTLPAPLEHLRVRARVLADGEVAWEAEYEAASASSPEGLVEVRWPSELLGETAREIVLEGTLFLAAPTAWCEAGHVVAVGQSIHARPEPPTEEIEGEADFTLGRWNVGVRHGESEALLSRTAGGIVQWKRGEEAMVLFPPRLTTFRPLTDNDRGAGHGFERACWTTAGAYARCVDTRVEPREGGVVVTYDYQLASLDNVIVPVRYELRTDGTIRLTATYPGAQNLPTMPCFGLEWALPSSIDRLRFYGLGPVEAYADRLAGANLGVWELSAAQGLAHYAVPQECGFHPGVRWCDVTDANGHGLHVQARSNLGISLLPYSSAQIENARHWWELPEPSQRTATYLRLLSAQMGVGGDDSWGSPVHDEFQIDATHEQIVDVTLSLL